MASEAEPHPLGMFKCQLCALTAPYSYVGQKPPDTQAVVLLEESYIMKDPFSELCGVRAVSGTEELAKTEDRQQECSQLELQTWPLVEARSEGEGPPFDSW